MSILNQVVKTKKKKPLAILAYGVHGIGKSSLPSEAKNPIYIGSEENDELDAHRFPKIETWDQLEAQLKTLRDEKHLYETVVIDTVDTLEQVAQKKILTGQNANKTMATAMGGYGKAYEQMADMFLDIRDNYLAKLRDQKGMHIVLLAHSEKNKHEDPMTNTSYDSYSTALHKKVKPIFEDWVSAILFINYDLIRTDRSDGKTVLEGLDGKRLIYTEERPSHIAKNRFNLPFEIEFEKKGTWAKLVSMIDAFYGKAEEKGLTEDNLEMIEIMKKIDELTPKMPGELVEPLSISIQRAVAKKNTKELERILNKMKSTINA